MFSELWYVISTIVGGILVITILGLFENKIKRKYPIFYGRMRIVYAYTSIITIIISYLAFYYLLQPFTKQTVLGDEFRCSTLSGGIYTFFTVIFIITSFILLNEVDKFSFSASIQFISVLLMQITVFIISISLSWAYIYLAVISFIIAFSFMLRSRNKKDLSLQEKKDYHLFILTNIINSSFFFLGIVFYNLSTGSFFFSSSDKMAKFPIWGIISFIFLLISFVGLGFLPPLHSPAFIHSIGSKEGKIMLIFIQRSIAVLLFIFLSISFQKAYAKQFFYLVLYAIGLIFVFWGTIAPLHKEHSLSCDNYRQIFATGLVIQLISNNYFTISSLLPVTIDLYASALFYYLVFSAIWVLTISLKSFLYYRYNLSDRLLPHGIARNEKTVGTLLSISYLLQSLLAISVSIFVTLQVLVPSDYTTVWILTLIVISVFSLISLVHSFKLIYYTWKKETAIEPNYPKNKIEMSLYLSTFFSETVSLFVLVFLFYLYKWSVISSFLLF